MKNRCTLGQGDGWRESGVSKYSANGVRRSKTEGMVMGMNVTPVVFSNVKHKKKVLACMTDGYICPFSTCESPSTSRSVLFKSIFRFSCVS